MTSPVPRPALDRAALERVLARAAELQQQATTDGTGSLSDEQILELGKEVGLSPDTLRQAMAEERGRVSVPDARGLAGAWFGASSISAARVVPGAPAAVLAALDDVMRRELPFDVSRRFPDRMQWTPRRGFLDVMRSQLVARSAEGAEVRLADDLAASVVAVDAQRTHVRLDANVGEARTRATAQSGVSLAAAGAATWIGGLIGVTFAVVIPVAAAIAVFGVASPRAKYRRRVLRVGAALEQLLDRLEFGPARRNDGIVDRLLGG